LIKDLNAAIDTVHTSMASFSNTHTNEVGRVEYVPTHSFNVNTSHPLIASSQEYMLYKKYVSIHSEDRDIAKYPISSEFEIEMPEDITNISAIKLIQWTFPANYNTFSILNSNVFFAFTINNPYNPGANGVGDELAFRVFEALFYSKDTPYGFVIEEGFYNPTQIAIEMTNKMNASVTSKIQSYFAEKATMDVSWQASLDAFNQQGGYTRFVVVYNNVSCKLWFGNRADEFVLISETGSLTNNVSEKVCMGEKKHLPDASNWGLAGFLGLSRCNMPSVSGGKFTDFSTYDGKPVPRFYYGDVFPGDDGYWLLPYTHLEGSNVYWVEPVYKLNLMGDAFIYMELAGLNCIDETKPYNVSNFTLTTNQTNGVVNAAFAKLPVPSTPLSQWFDRDSVPYKFFYPPAERIRRLKIKLRYHNGQQVNFGVFNYSFTLEFTTMLPMILRDSRTSVYPQPVGR